MALSKDWQGNLKLIFNEAASLITGIKTLDAKNVTTRDVLTIIGLVVTGMKGLYAGWQMYAAFKEYGVARLMKPNLIDKYGTWALVIGAEEGIGEAYMTELATCGMNLLLVSFRPERIRAAAVYLEEKYKIKAQFADIDFTDCKSVYEQIEASLEDREIGVMVSNINIHTPYPMYFTEIPDEDLRAIIHGNILSATMCTRLVLPQMVERGRGAIVIIGSAMGNKPMMHRAVTGATKAYLDYFASCLNMEYKEMGITVQTLVPSFIAGQEHNVSALESENLLVPSAQTYAHSAVRTLGWSDRTSGCLSHTIQQWLSGIVPEWFLQWGLNQLVSFFRNEAMERLGIDEDSAIAKATANNMQFDTSFMAPPSLLGILGNNTG